MMGIAPARNGSHIQYLLEENDEYLQRIQDCYDQGRTSDLIRHQSLLHRNLVYIAHAAEIYDRAFELPIPHIMMFENNEEPAPAVPDINGQGSPILPPLGSLDQLVPPSLPQDLAALPSSADVTTTNSNQSLVSPSQSGPRAQFVPPAFQQHRRCQEDLIAPPLTTDSIPINSNCQSLVGQMPSGTQASPSFQQHELRQIELITPPSPIDQQPPVNQSLSGARSQLDATGFQQRRHQVQLATQLSTAINQQSPPVNQLASGTRGHVGSQGLQQGNRRQIQLVTLPSIGNSAVNQQLTVIQSPVGTQNQQVLPSFQHIRYQQVRVPNQFIRGEVYQSQSQLLSNSQITQGQHSANITDNNSNAVRVQNHHPAPIYSSRVSSNVQLTPTIHSNTAAPTNYSLSQQGYPSSNNQQRILPNSEYVNYNPVPNSANHGRQFAHYPNSQPSNANLPYNLNQRPAINNYPALPRHDAGSQRRGAPPQYGLVRQVPRQPGSERD